jgi:hypothetical protein
MAQDRLHNAVMRRLKELGLPPSLMDLAEFRHRFFFEGWVMFVRDGDQVANVHLVQPQQRMNSLRPRHLPNRER